MYFLSKGSYKEIPYFASQNKILIYDLLDSIRGFIKADRVILLKLDNESNFSCSTVGANVFSVSSISDNLKEYMFSLDEDVLVSIPESLYTINYNSRYVHAIRFSSGWLPFATIIIEHNSNTIDSLVHSYLSSIVKIIKNIIDQFNNMYAIFDNLNLYIFISDGKTSDILYANKLFKERFGNDVLGQSYKLLFNYNLNSINTVEPVEVYSNVIKRWVAFSRSVFIDSKSDDLKYIFFGYDIVSKKSYEDQIRHIAYTDHLTGLPNRYKAELVLKDLIDYCNKNKLVGYTLFIDLDDFKIINDCYGHNYGDGVLIDFSNYLKLLFVGDNYVFRFGGDEFVVFINPNNAKYIYNYLSDIFKRVESPWYSVDREFYCSLSVGVVPFPVDGDNVPSVIKKADIAMYQAKRDGKNSFVFYKDGQNSETLRRNDIEFILRKAISNNLNGFEVYFQLYLNLYDDTFGAEALVRIVSEDGDIIGPEDFIHLAEYLGFIGDIDTYVLERAAAVCKKINDSGQPNFTMTVNLSRVQLKKIDLLSVIDSVINDTEVNPSNMILGVKEGVVIQEYDRLTVISKDLKERNIKVALDDFGSGNASFINLDKIPVDIVKLSPIFTAKIDGSDLYPERFIRLMHERSRDLGKLFCVNGIETQMQYDFCIESGIDIIQGYYIYQPSSYSKLIEILNII